MKCIICGKREALVGGMCPECFLESKKFVNPPKKVELSICPRCGAIKLGNNWNYDLNRDKGIDKIILKETSLEDDRVNFTFSWKIIENQNLLELIYNIKFNESEKSEMYQVPLIIKIQTCPRCSKFSGDYFESILQIRSSRKLTRSELDDIKDFVLKTIEREMLKNPELYILKQEFKDSGFDLYLSANNSAKIISKKISERYGATVKESPQLAGVKDGEKFYRVTYSVRMPDYAEGDFIKLKNERFKILAIKKGQIKVRNIENGNIGSITQKDFIDKEYSIFARKDDVENAIVLYEKNNEIAIMETKNYATTIVKKPPFNVSKEVLIIKDGENVFIVDNKI
ncbi:MAG: 60S ribosomal export protein NMD3 [Thermoplasmata archaeon]|nr:NMD3-related protein [Thermoplasmata archaeon]